MSTNAPSVPTSYNVTMTLADTQYSQVLPAGLKRVQLRCIDGTAMRYAYATGTVAAPTAPYHVLPANGVYWDELDGQATQLTLYVACGSAGKVAEILAWV